MLSKVLPVNSYNDNPFLMFILSNSLWKCTKIDTKSLAAVDASGPCVYASVLSKVNYRCFLPILILQSKYSSSRAWIGIINVSDHWVSVAKSLMWEKNQFNFMFSERILRTLLKLPFLYFPVSIWILKKSI